jgi:hypothetical protein
MRSTAWIGSGAALGIALGSSLLAGLGALGGAGDALAQGMPNVGGSGYRTGAAAAGYRKAANPAPQMKGYYYRPAKRVKRYYRPVAPRTCGQFRYWSTEKARCLDARTTPPKLK